MNPGQIVIVNGTSGSGKSTTCETFQREADGYWMLHGIDHFIAGTLPAKYGHHGPLAHEGIEAVPVDPADPDGPLKWRFHEHGIRAFAAFHEWIAAASRTGNNIILDHLLMSGTPVLADLARRLEGLPVLLVTLKPPVEVLESRVAERKMDKKLPVDILGEDAVRKIVDRLNRLRGWFTESVYANPYADLVVDTAIHGPETVTRMIRDRLAQGPGTALEELRRSLSRS
ncbi:MAG: AAA family ATPase [Sphingomonadales bacterium]|nr:AAA family ATPase [Sphingomonadales bacterium]